VYESTEVWHGRQRVKGQRTSPLAPRRFIVYLSRYHASVATVFTGSSAAMVSAVGAGSRCRSTVSPVRQRGRESRGLLLPRRTSVSKKQMRGRGRRRKSSDLIPRGSQSDSTRLYEANWQRLATVDMLPWKERKEDAARFSPSRPLVPRKTSNFPIHNP
jgi:hypothetical protein